MNLHIFGHSICLQSNKDLPLTTFTDILVRQYNIPLKNLHVSLCGSEERILYFLKKTKDPIDGVIIFHGDPGLVFVPTLERDMHPNTPNDYFWRSPSYQYLKFFENVSQDKSEKVTSLKPLSDFKRAFNYFLTYFYTKDLNANRHYGALIQIDQYLTYKNIPAIHCVLDNTMPTWFKFSSGIVDKEITQMQKSSSEYSCDPRFSANRINQLGNQIIAEKLIEYIKSWHRE